MSDQKNPYVLLDTEQPSDAIIQVAARLEDEELMALVKELHSQQISSAGARTADRLRQLDVRAVLEQGCLLHLMKLASSQAQHELVFENVFADSGICRTQGFRSLAVWRRLGRVLTQEPRLQEFFVPEALKLLSAESSPDSALAEGLDRARGGELLRIKQAKSLIKKHAPKAPEQNKPRKSARSPKTENLFRKWSYSGQVVRVELKPTQPLDREDLQTVIGDLQAALSELQTMADQTLIDQLVVV